MTYQKPTLNYGTGDADESSPLVLIVDDASPSLAVKKKKAQTLAVVAACFLFFTLGVVYQGSSNSVGMSGALLLRSAGQSYDPSTDYCFKADNLDQYCWYTSDSMPYGSWKGVSAPTGANSGCGTMCTEFAASNGGSEACDDDQLGQCNPACNDYSGSCSLCGTMCPDDR